MSYESFDSVIIREGKLAEVECIRIQCAICFEMTTSKPTWDIITKKETL